jgi:hypothetical protein
MRSDSALSIDPIWENGSAFYRVIKSEVEIDPVSGNKIQTVADIFHCDCWEIALELINVNYRAS